MADSPAFFFALQELPSMLPVCLVEADMACLHGLFCLLLLLAAHAAIQSDYSASNCAAYCLGSPA